ncbi:MAG TPA: FAD/NAD(P)-binding oxidoreductase [Candidatus Acidoferrum sp.]|nr:FAD/NAD(P)-binding oxidoreductase [Candidatus Acidoferrum sp.]
MSERGSHTFDVLIVGAGPAGIAAASAAAESGATVGIVDDNPGPGGQIWRGLPANENVAPKSGHDGEQSEWHARLQRARVKHFYGTRIVAQGSPEILIAETYEETFTLEYKKLILATGARERFLPFPGWTLPGVMGAGGWQSLVKSGCLALGNNIRVVIAGSGPLLLAIGAFVRKMDPAHRPQLVMIAEQAPRSRIQRFALRLLGHGKKLLQATQLRMALADVPYRMGTWPVRAGGTGKLEWVEMTNGRKTWRVACDYLACGFHLVPNTELAELLGCELRGGFVRVDELQETTAANIFCAGEPVGIGGVETALIEGQIAGYAATGKPESARGLLQKRAAARRFAALLEETFALREELRELPAPDTFVCRCEDVTFDRLTKRSGWRDAKLHTRCGMGPCQGRVCGPAAEFLFGWKVDSVRPPIFPARVESLAMIGSAKE